MSLTTVIVEISSSSRIDMSYTPYTCVASRREQKHCAVTLTHNFPCIALSCSRRRHIPCSPWLHAATSLYSFARILHKSGTGIQGKRYADFDLLFDQTQMVVNLRVRDHQAQIECPKDCSLSIFGSLPLMLDFEVRKFGVVVDET